MTDPVTLAAAARYVGAVWGSLTGRGGWSRADRQARDAAVASGEYRPAPRGMYRDRAGRVVSARVVVEAGRSILADDPDEPLVGSPGNVIPPSPVPGVLIRPEIIPTPRQLPTGGDILDDLLKRPHVPTPEPTELEKLLKRGPLSDFERLLNRPDARIGTRILGTVARVAGPIAVIADVLYPNTTAADDTISERELRDRIGKREKARRKGPPRRKRPRLQPRVPTSPPEWQAPTSPRPSVPRSEPRAPNTPRDPGAVVAPRPKAPAPSTPTAPRPTVRPAPAARPRIPRPTAGTAYAPLLPLLFPFPSRSSRPSVKPAPAPLTITQPSPLAYTSPNCPPCSDSRPRRSRSKKRCTNAITNRKTYTRGGSKYQTITRKLEC